MVNELLIAGSNCAPSLYFRLCKQCALLPQEKMLPQLAVLKNLESFSRSNIAADIFSATETATYPLFALLLRSDIERIIGHRVLNGLQQHPQDSLIQGVASLLTLTNQDHKLFLYTYLRQASAGTIPHSLKKIAAKIIEEALPRLPVERRKEAWVAHAIETLGKLQSESSNILLEGIITTKKMVILHEWPPPCRKAAEAALVELKINKRGGRNA